MNGVRNAHAAQPYVVAGRERVHVKAAAVARFEQGRRAAEQPLGQHEILARGQLHVVAGARDQLNRQPRPLGQRRIVGEAVLSCRGGTPVRGENVGEVEGLRGLGTPQISPLDRVGDEAVGGGAL